jgi:hypothetical protein
MMGSQRSSGSRRAAVAAALACAACSDDTSYIVVSVETRPAVHSAATLRVTLSNAGSMRTEEIPLGEATFPATFSVAPEGRSGEIGIAIDAIDAAGLVVGRGSAVSGASAATARVMLEPTDFVVNTDYADDQFLSNYASANGLQLAATSDGTWAAVFTGACATPCNVLARRFDATGRPVRSALAAGTQAFSVSTKLTTFFSTPILAASGGVTLALWNHDDPGSTAYSLDCRAFDRDGAPTTGQLTLTTDEFPLVLSAAPLASGNVVLAWDGRVTSIMVRSAIVRPDCTLVGAPAQVSTAGGVPIRSHVATTANRILYAWTLASSVRVRVARQDGTFVTGDLELVARTPTEKVEYVRVAPLGAGFAVAVRWVLASGATGPGRIELFRLTGEGALAAPAPTVITDRSGTDLATAESFGVAPRPDGSLFVVWHACMERGDGSGCGVFGRLVAPDGLLSGPEIPLATTTANDQTGPAAVVLPGGAIATAWTDRSGAAPDAAGTAVRARILYLPGT